MFFNCCRRNCCCNQKCCDKQEKNYCDIKDKYDYDKCDKRDDKHDKCDYGKQEKGCCHINPEKKCCCDKNYNSHFDNKSDSSCFQNDRSFNDNSYYGEYNNLGYFGYDSKEGYFEQDTNKSYDRKERRNIYDEENNHSNNCTDNWDNDRKCNCEKEKSDKQESKKCCRPEKYICFPFDRY